MEDDGTYRTAKNYNKIRMHNLNYLVNKRYEAYKELRQLEIQGIKGKAISDAMKKYNKADYEASYCEASFD